MLLRNFPLNPPWECKQLRDAGGHPEYILRFQQTADLRARLHGEFHPGLKSQAGFWNKSSQNQIVDYMERDSARGAIQLGLKILKRYAQTGLGFSARPNGPVNLKKVSCNRNGISARAEEGTRAYALTVFSHLSKLSHGNLRFAPGLTLKLSM